MDNRVASLARILSLLLALTLLLVFLFAPFGGLNAYRIYNFKQSGWICQKGFCLAPAEWTASYGYDNVTYYYCDTHKGELSQRKVTSGKAVLGFAYYGSMFFVAVGLFLVIHYIRNAFKGEKNAVLGVLVSALFTNFIPWLYHLFS